MGSHGLPESLPELEGLTNQMPKNKPGQDRQDRTKPLVGARAYSVRTAQKMVFSYTTWYNTKMDHLL